MQENAAKQAETKKEARTQLHVRQEYFQLATQAGDLAYRIAMEKEQLEELWGSMRKLNEEAAELQAQAILNQANANKGSAAPEVNHEAPATPQ